MSRIRVKMSCFGKLHSFFGHRCTTNCDVPDDCFDYQYVIAGEPLNRLARHLVSPFDEVRDKAKERLGELLRKRDYDYCRGNS